MKRFAVAIKFCLLVFLTVTCLAQEASWRTEQYDSLLIAPAATELKYAEPGEGLHELTYTIDEPYPARNVIDFICEDMRRKGWGEPVKYAGDGWMMTAIPGKSRVPYHWWAAWGRKKNEEVTYTLDYPEDDSRHYLKTLHVRAVYDSQVFDVDEHLRQIHAEVLKNRAQKEFEWPGDLTNLLLFLLFGPPLVIAFTKARRYVFYRGPNAWLTQINLGLFGAVLLPVLFIGAMLIYFLIPYRIVRLIPAVSGPVIMAVLPHAGYLACAVVPFFVVAILRDKEIPNHVKITHAVLSVSTLSFFVLCIHLLSRPLMHW